MVKDSKEEIIYEFDVENVLFLIFTLSIIPLLNYSYLLCLINLINAMYLEILSFFKNKICFLLCENLNFS